MNNQSVIDHFEKQVKECSNMKSPFMAKLIKNLLAVLDDQTKTGEAIENWLGDPAQDALALRLCGGLHSIVIANPLDPLAKIYRDRNYEDYLSILQQGLTTHDATLVKWLKLPPQTNETGRASALIIGLLNIARETQFPIHLCEIGTSAGLNLQLEQFYYEFGDEKWGNADSLVQLKPEMRGGKPDLSGEVNLTSRIGCDISPVDISDPSEQMRLCSYIWPDQQYRIDRVNGAINIALENPPHLLALDAAEFVEQQLSQRPKDQVFVLMHSVVWQYLPAETQKKIEGALAKYGENANAENPIYWLRLEGLGGIEPAARLTLDKWPNHSHETLARSCFHGSWLEFV